MRFAIAVATMAVALVFAPAHAAPCAGFTDVDDTSGFCTGIAWMKNRGITLGCTSTTLYCPGDFVRRDQMAAFLYRLGFQNAFLQGGNGFGAPAVLGTSDGQPVEVVVNGSRVARFAREVPDGPNVVVGHAANAVDAASPAQTIAGGGVDGSGCYDPLTDPLTRSCANHASGWGATVGGGFANQAQGEGALVAGGSNNTAAAYGATVPGGVGNRVGEAFSFAAGYRSSATGVASFALGDSAAASASHSFAIGRRAKATTQGSFIWADARNFDFQPSVPNYFGVRATGGVGLAVAIDGTTGAATQYCNLAPGVASWQCVSDRNAKENFTAVDKRDMLERLVAMPLSSWNFKGTDPGLRMLGPTAQDFRSAFGLGSDDKTIATVNLDGVALAAIQGLNAKLETQLAVKDAEIAALRQALAGIEARHVREIADLRLAVEVLSAGTAGEERNARSR